ncbi:MAG: beta-lactamase family protein [Ruminococcaceae bacterium]|nr:beta-lactamase family protein [Oscillospiraceae bacterium]
MEFSKLKNLMDKFVSEYNTPGVDVIVYKNHEMLFRYFTGFSDIENNKKMNGDELYLIFSMTKMITCTCALQLLEQGKFLLSDPVSKYLPEFEKMKISSDELDIENAAKITTGASVGESIKTSDDGYAKNQITIKNLFTMGAGLDYDLRSESIKKSLAEGKISTRELVSAIAQKPLGFEPGTRYRYSLCHDVLGALIEIWSGKKLGDYMKENLFDPLGMKNTFFGVPKDEERLSKMAARYTYDKDRKPQRNELECVYNLSNEYQSGGAGLTSSCEDYALFLDALACGGVGKTGNKILSSATIELMGTNHLNEKQYEDFQSLQFGYGYGLGVRTHTDKAISGSLSPLGEFGWDGAAGAFSMVDPKNNLSLTYFQHIHGWDKRLQREMKNALYACLD